MKTSTKWPTIRIYTVLWSLTNVWQDDYWFRKRYIGGWRFRNELYWRTCPSSFQRWNTWLWEPTCRLGSGYCKVLIFHFQEYGPFWFRCFRTQEWNIFLLFTYEFHWIGSCYLAIWRFPCLCLWYKTYTLSKTIDLLINNEGRSMHGTMMISWSPSMYYSAVVILNMRLVQLPIQVEPSMKQIPQVMNWRPHNWWRFLWPVGFTVSKRDIKKSSLTTFQ